MKKVPLPGLYIFLKKMNAYLEAFLAAFLGAAFLAAAFLGAAFFAAFLGAAFFAAFLGAAFFAVAVVFLNLIVSNKEFRK